MTDPQTRPPGSRPRPGPLASLAVSGFALGFALVVAEAAVRVRFGIPLDAVSPGLSVPPLFEPDPGSGYRLRPGFAGYAYGAWVEVDERGHRRTPETAPGAPDLVALGDSSCFGFGVGQGATHADHVAARLGPGIRVRNLAVPGYNARQAVDRLLSTGSLRPAGVVLFVDSNDGADPYGLVRSAGYDLLAPRDAPPATSKILAKAALLDRSVLACLVRSISGRRFSVPGSDPYPLEPRIAGPIVELARALSASGGARLLVMPLRRSFLDEARADFEALAERHGFDVKAALTDAEYKTLGWDPHPGPESHRIMAERILEWWTRAGAGTAP